MTFMQTEEASPNQDKILTAGRTFGDFSAVLQLHHPVPFLHLRPTTFTSWDSVQYDKQFETYQSVTATAYADG